MTCQWMALVAALAQWARSLVVRKNAYGKYIPPGRRTDPKKIAFTVKAEPTEDVLKAHFSGGSIVGLFVLDDSGFCRLFVVDIDRHDEAGSPEANEKAAIAFFDRAVSMGFSAFLEDSNGRGGYKIWLIFKEPVPARWVRRYLRWLVSDWEDQGLERVPEIFPKQDELGPGKLGNFVRLPGRHHTLDHKSRIWGDGQWLRGEAAAQRILDTVGSTVEVIPEEFRTEAASPSSPPAPKNAQGGRPSEGLLRLIRSAIGALPASFPGSYDEWLKVGMSLFELGDVGLELWEEISRRCPKYRQGACREKWPTFKPGGGLTYKTILHFAKQNGWKFPKRKKNGRPEDDADQNALSVQNVSAAEERHKAAQSDLTGDGGGKSVDATGGGSNGEAPPAPNSPMSATPGNGANRPTIVWNIGTMHPVTAKALEALKLSNQPPLLFTQGGSLSRIQVDERGPYTKPLDEFSMRGILDRSAYWARSFGKDKEGKEKLVLTPPPRHIVMDLLSLPFWPTESFPPLVGIVRCPVMAEDGSLVDKPGYHKASKLWYEPETGLVVPAIPLNPTDDDRAKAKVLLLDELLVNFPFNTNGDRANALAYLIAPLARNLIKGPTPFGLVEAPAPGTGKGLLAKCLAIPAVGMPNLSAQPESDAEWRKAITAKLRDSPQIVYYDNLTKKLESSALEEVLTTEIWSDRELGVTRTITVPVRCTWLGTSNNLSIMGDLHRRIVWIKLDAKMERPEERDPSSFRHPDVVSWALQHRGDLLWAALVLIRTWVVKGRPPGPQNMGSFESWAKTLGGILQVAGVEGFLSEQKERRVNADEDSALWQGFYDVLFRKYGSSNFSVSKLGWVVNPEDEGYEEELLPGILNAKAEAGRRRQLGKLFQKNRDRVYGRFQLVEDGRDSHSKTPLYKVKEVVKASGKQAELETEVQEQPVGSTGGPTINREISKGPFTPKEHTLSEQFWQHVTRGDLQRDYECDDGGQLWELCHALWLSCSPFRLVTDRALVRFAESRRLLTRILTSDTEEGRMLDLHARLDDVNFVLRGLMEIRLFDQFEFGGRKTSRFAIDWAEQEDDLVQGVPLIDDAEYQAAEYYSTFVEICRYWWVFQEHEIIIMFLLDLVHEFNLLPGFDDAYDPTQQLKELNQIFLAVCGIEFEGFVITEVGHVPLVTERDSFFRLELLEGYPPPVKPDNSLDPVVRRTYAKPYTFSGKDFPRLCPF